MSSAFEEKKTGDGGDDGQRYDTGGRLSFAPESLLSAPSPPSPLYTLKCCLQVSEGHHQKKDVFWRHVSKGNSLRLRQYSSILFAAATDPVLEVCSTTRALESGNFNCPSRPGHTG